MKRVYCFTVFVLLLCLPFLLSAQLPVGVHIPVGKGGAGTTESRVVVTDECELTYNFRLAVFNLDLLNSLDYGYWVVGNVYPEDLTLPEEYGPMFLRCELNGISDVFEVETFSFAPLEGGGYGFVFDYSITIDIREDCDGEDANTDQTYVARMSLLSDAGADYPLCDYTAPDDLFDSYYLQGNSSTQKCFNEDWVRWEEPIDFKCGDDCELLDPKVMDVSGGHSLRGGNFNTETRNYSDSEDETSIGLEVYPNPFNTELNFKWKSASENSKIRLYNSNGQLVKSRFISKHQVGEITKISMNELPKGIYFLIVESEGKTTHNKLIKT